MTAAAAERARALPEGREIVTPARAVTVSSGGRSVELSLDRGTTYRLLAPEAELAGIIEDLSRSGLAGVVPCEGGLIGNLKVWENIALPLAWQGKSEPAVVERRVRAMFAALGIAGEDFSALCRSLPERLSRLELRLVAFARGMLIEPEIMVYDRLFEGLSQAQMEQARTLDTVFRRQFPFRTSIYLESEPPPLAVRIDAERNLR